eukprot:Rmarinus@m.13864
MYSTARAENTVRRRGALWLAEISHHLLIIVGPFRSYFSFSPDFVFSVQDAKVQPKSSLALKYDKSSLKAKASLAALAAKAVASVEPKGLSGEAKKLAEANKNLPEGWLAMLDPESKEIYYGNLSTKETTWDRPK